ncbi:MAG: aldo/keto reductase [Alphaproteobacteria bacterium]|nr:aldo/keto reductase [Alphaproteobacteria bacterium]
MRAPTAPELSRADFLKGLAGVGGAAMLGNWKDAMAKPTPIQTRKIPKGGERLPIVGLGTWQTFDIGGDTEARAQRQEVLRLLFEGGGSVIDSSPMYGRSEAVVGDLLAAMGARDRAFLATKVWTWGEDKGIRQMKDSLENFKSPRIELMQIHNLVDWQTHLRTLRQWKEAGTFRYIGITHYTDSGLDELMAVMRTEELDFVQMAYSIGSRAAEETFLPYVADRGVAVLVNRPYEGGGLFRKTRGTPLPAWAAEYGIASWGQFFLKYVLSHPAVTCVIPGTSKPKHMADNLGAGRGPLPDAKTRDRMARMF